MAFTLAQFVFRGNDRELFGEGRPHVAYILLTDEDYERACATLQTSPSEPQRFDDARPDHKPLVVRMDSLACIHAGATRPLASDFTL